ncbi:MAG TPA: hypothetical protein ENH11_05775 [Candidatus Acetothermia bacterium]|nr:hypothetical protein [Candidatus Acetothermia bacterium]
MDSIDEKDLRERLIKLGAPRLADALIYISSYTKGGTEYVQAMLLTPDEAEKRFKSKLSGLKRRRKYVGWNEAQDFALELKLIIASLREGMPKPKRGLQLVADFFSLDGRILDRCDDSSGEIGYVFRFDARNLFISYASRCSDKRFVSDLLLKLYEHDDYGVRTELVAKASHFLPEEEMRDLVANILERAKSEEPGSYEADGWWIAAQMLARQLHDPGLFERAKLAADQKLSSPTCMDIAVVYLENGDPEMALFWMERIPPTDRFRADLQDRLLYSIYERLGDKEKMAERAWSMFLNNRNRDTLDMLLRALGESERERVIEEQTQQIMAGEGLSYIDAEFLMDVGRIDNSAEYLFRYRDQLDGDSYSVLVPLAKSLEAGGRFLVASIVYRALLESILARAQSRYYHHGVRYLKKLDTLSLVIDDWRGLPSHEEYRKTLLEEHKRKRSFWSKYGV